MSELAHFDAQGAILDKTNRETETNPAVEFALFAPYTEGVELIGDAAASGQVFFKKREQTK